MGFQQFLNPLWHYTTPSLLVHCTWDELPHPYSLVYHYSLPYTKRYVQESSYQQLLIQEKTTENPIIYQQNGEINLGPAGCSKPTSNWGEQTERTTLYRERWCGGGGVGRSLLNWKPIGENWEFGV